MSFNGRTAMDDARPATKLKKQERDALVEALLSNRSRWSLQPVSVLAGDHTPRQEIDVAIRQMEKLMPPAFILGPMPMIVTQYRLLRFAQGPRNMADMRITIEAIRRQIRKLITVASKPDDAALKSYLDVMAPQAKHYVAVSMQLPNIRIGTYYDGVFDGVAQEHLRLSARLALDHPHLAKRARGRRADRAGDALIWSAYRAYPLYTGQEPRVWADGRGFSDFIAVVALLLELAGDPRHEATLRDRCRKALRQEPKPPYEGLLFARCV
ncbi:hypothetical protein [Marilutibacter maris]|uniref:hypothetical protein n=1 Tax=Marilutibacter maris TaxID=1605891 RepID=UPI0011AE391E|nr:hypothetical protein [Lysobacter maris]